MTARPSCAAESPRSATAEAGNPDATSAVMAADGPGSTSTGRPATTHACTSTYPGSETNGIPASDTNATTAPSRIRPTSSADRARSLCSW